MDRTNGADFVDIGGGKRGFRDENRSAGVIGTEVNAAFLNSIQEELMAVITSEGLVPNSGDWTQLLQALTAKFDSVRIALPIFPRILTTNAVLTITSPAAGTVRVGAGDQFIIRGSKTWTTVQTDLAAAASKVYHLRWRADTGFTLKDLSSLTYNPTALSEDDRTFDSTYDDMLVARVTTNAGNVATITPLANRPTLISQTERRDILVNALNWVTLAGTGVTLNWARTPDVVYFAMNEWRSNNAGPDGSQTSASAGTARAIGGRIPAAGRTRYAIPALEYYYEDDNLTHGTASWTILLQAF